MFHEAIAAALREAPDGERLVEELATFGRRHGLAVDELAGRDVLAASLPAELAWAFVADHLITHVSLPVSRLDRMAATLAHAVDGAAAAGRLDPASASAIAREVRDARRELRRLDKLAKALRALAEGDRPGKELYRADPAAYAAAMRTWEANQPHVEEEASGGFTVHEIDEHTLRLDRDVTLDVPADVRKLARVGDRIDALVGRTGHGHVVLEAWAAARPGR